MNMASLLETEAPDTPGPGPDPTWARIGGRIVQARHAAGLQQLELAERIGISKRQLYNLESGKASPYTHLVAIAEATARSADWLEHGEHVRPGELAEAAVALREALESAQADRQVLLDVAERLAALVEQRREDQ